MNYNLTLSQLKDLVASKSNGDCRLSKDGDYYVITYYGTIMTDWGDEHNREPIVIYRTKSPVCLIDYLENDNLQRVLVTLLIVAYL